MSMVPSATSGIQDSGTDMMTIGAQEPIRTGSGKTIGNRVHTPLALLAFIDRTDPVAKVLRRLGA